MSDFHKLSAIAMRDDIDALRARTEKLEKENDRLRAEIVRLRELFLEAEEDIETMTGKKEC